MSTTGLRRGPPARHLGIRSTAADVVDDDGSVVQRGLRNCCVHGVDADPEALCGEFFDDDGNHRGDLHGRIDPDSAGPGGLAPDIDDVGAVGHQLGDRTPSAGRVGYRPPSEKESSVTLTTPITVT